MKRLSGFWAGTYWYPDPAYPPVHFDCELRLTDSNIAGQTTEVDIFRPAGLFLLNARLVGNLNARHISFQKTYTNATDYYKLPVNYSGKIGLTGKRISGIWEINGWGGKFIMTRDKGHWRVADAKNVANDTEEKEPA